MDYPYAHRSSLGIIRRMETRRITLTNDVAETRRVPTPVSGARPVAEQRDPSPSIADLAGEVQISPFHFIRQFEAVFGVTPHQFRIQVRLDAAKQLLATGTIR